MPDVPAMAFIVCSIERLVAWSQDRRWHQAVLGAVFLSLAMLTRAYAIPLLGMAALLLLATTSRPFVTFYYRSLLPWTWSRSSEINRFELWQVR